MANFSPSDINKYRTFRGLLTRRHAPSSHSISEYDSATRAVVVADLRVVVYGSVVEDKKLWVKGGGFSVASVVANKAARRTLRLCCCCEI